jgi:hypothetical protein
MLSAQIGSLWQQTQYTDDIPRDVLFLYSQEFFQLLVHGDVTIAGEGLQHLGLWSALRAFEQGGILIVPHLLWNGALVFGGVAQSASGLYM